MKNVSGLNKEKEEKIDRFQEQIKTLSLKIEELTTLNMQQNVF